MYLYKFMPVSDHEKRIDWINKIITDKQIFLPNAKKLNDPFECMVQWHNAEYAVNDKALMLSLFFHENLVERTGVLSFSQSFEKILMWSHYGASHSGICLKFKVINHEIYKKYFKEVIYSLNMPTNQKYAYLWTKSKEWKYEKEIRYIAEQGVNGYVELSDLGLELSSVVVGPRISTDDLGKIVNLCNKRFENYLTSTQLSRKQYKIEMSDDKFIDIKNKYLNRKAMDTLRMKKIKESKGIV